jgi:hypothetical protein
MRAPLLILALVGVLVPRLAVAQGTPTGTISGRVTSSDGLPLPGVTVTATAPVLQGDRTAVTTGER